jgi:hypothetical protein
MWLDRDRLHGGDSPRAAEVDASHVANLAGLEGTWPPIVVYRRDGKISHGQHRVAAARSLGSSQVAAAYFDGSDDEAFVEHGLLLSCPDAGVRPRSCTPSTPLV